ncbi:MAG: glycosyltransferase [Aestuariibacter sp.]|nr:glycosyltransferase [Aestuariibacter sp.]
MDADSPAKYWDYFDKFYCISLDERADRQGEAKRQFGKIGLLERVEFVIVKKHPYNIEQGIYESHLTCMGKGIRAGADTIVVFEDDILFERFSPADLKNCIDFLSTNQDWNALYFGCLVSGSKKTQHRSVLKVKYRCLTHAYVLTRKFAELLVKKSWREIPFDDWLCSLNDEFYAIYPSFAFQSNSPSDNIRFLPLDKFRRLCGGLRWLQKANELYHRRRTLVILLHIVIILLILMLAL